MECGFGVTRPAQRAMFQLKPPVAGIHEGEFPFRPRSVAGPLQFHQHRRLRSVAPTNARAATSRQARRPDLG